MKKTNSKKKQIQIGIRVNPETLEELKNMAKEDGRSVNNLIERALSGFVDRPKVSIVKVLPCLDPPMSTLVKLGSIIVHAQEIRDNPHYFDSIAFDQCINDPEVVEWLKEMDELAFLPKKRS